MDIKSLADGDFMINEIVVLNCSWKPKIITNYMQNSRKNNLLFYMTEGQRHYCTPEKEFDMQENSCIFMPVGHQYFSAPVVQSRGFTIDFQIVSDKREIVQPDLPYNLPVHDDSGSLLFLFEKIYHEYMYGGGNRLKLYSYFLRLLDDFSSRTHQVQIHKDEYAEILPALDYLDRSFNQNTKVKDLAKLCFLSETNFRKKFTAYTGLSPSNYRMELRIKKAADLLKSESCSVEKAAAETGFHDTAHFCRMFKRYTSVTPRKYKKELN